MVLKYLRIIVVSFSGLALISAIWGGLYRIGWTIPMIANELPGIHGPLIVCGFLGTMFSFDRAIVLKKFWGDVVPVFILIGSFLLFINPISRMCPLFVFVGSLGFIAICYEVNRVQPNLFNRMILTGSILWVTGITIWLFQWPVYNIYLWWMGFVLFTMVGQRLELARRIRLSQPPFYLLSIALGIVFVGEIVMALGHLHQSDSVLELIEDYIRDPRSVWGMRLAGLGFLLTGVWLLIYDAAWGLLKGKGLAKYASICLISGYMWLVISGLLSLIFSGRVSGIYYDALIHSFFIGFVWFNIFGHGPVLVLASMGIRVKSAIVFYAPVVILYASLILRVFGDLIRNRLLIKNGGLLNGIALLFFFIILGFQIFNNRVKEV